MPAYICKTCGERASVSRRSPSSFGAEILVWLGALIVAGLVGHWIPVLAALAFSFWRFAARAMACGKCGSRDVIPLDSPIGRQLTGHDARKTYEETIDKP